MKVIHIGLPKTAPHIYKKIYLSNLQREENFVLLENRQVSDSINDHIVKMFSVMKLTY